MAKRSKVNKERRKWTLVILGILAFIALLYYGIIGAVYVNFIIGEDLIFWMNPPSKAFSLHHNGTAQYDIVLTTNNKLFCVAECDYAFIDVSDDTVIDEGSAMIEPKETLNRSYIITAPLFGEGQRLYRFEATCNNLNTFMCRSPEAESTRSSFITMVYGPSDEEQEIIGGLTTRLAVFLAKLADADVDLKRMRAVSDGFPESFEWRALQARMESAETEFSGLYEDSEGYHVLWDAQRFLELESVFEEGADQLSQETGDIVIGIVERQAAHNDTAELLGTGISISHTLSGIYNSSFVLMNKSLATEVYDIAQSLDDLGIAAAAGSFNEYSALQDSFGKIGMDTAELEDLWSVVVSNAAGSLHNERLRLDSALCDLKGVCTYNRSSLTKIQDACESIATFESEFMEADMELSEWAYRRYLLKDPPNSTTDELKLAVTDLINISTWVSSAEYGKFVLGAKTDYIISRARLDVPDLMGTPAENLTNDTKRILIMFGMSVSYDELVDDELCERTKSNTTVNRMENALGVPYIDPHIPDIEQFSIIFPEMMADVDTTLTEHSPECCVFSDCKPCCTGDECRDDPQSWPVLFVHGHAVNKQTSPDFSLTVFNSLQQHMEDDGYINGGFLSLETDPESMGYGIYGFSGHPVTMKATYYYDVYSEDGRYVTFPEKSESIDVYAIRLKEIIDAVKYLTGRPKVNIIAHSMGGLVSRRYLQIFGEDSVEHLIMIGTPNGGIEGRVLSYCPILGEQKECDDMAKGSIFLKKLNNPSKQPEEVKMMTIMGSGCDMEGNDGDGVVLVENVPIDGADNRLIKGSCPETLSSLHSGMLKLDSYPETYDHIKEGLTS